jgi:hypothetical protein
MMRRGPSSDKTMSARAVRQLNGASPGPYARSVPNLTGA